jgi:hypothetical protein
MMIPAPWPQSLDFFRAPLVIEPSAGQLSSDAGLLPLRYFDERIGLARAFADALDDPRDPDLTEHTVLEMVRSRLSGILAGYEDQNDHDTLRTDPVFKLVAGRPPPRTTWPASRRCPASRQRHFRLGCSGPIGTRSPDLSPAAAPRTRLTEYRVTRISLSGVTSAAGHFVHLEWRLARSPGESSGTGQDRPAGHGHHRRHG